jgi:hypothetical protein
VVILALAILYMTGDDGMRARLLSLAHMPEDCGETDATDPATVRDGTAAPAADLGDGGSACGSYRTSRAPAADPVAN